jgi:hypothetical protein
VAQLPNPFGESNQDIILDDIKSTGLVGYIVDKVRDARRHRDQIAGDRWKEYTRLWRGFWSESDKNRESERSRIISPALSNSIEMTVAEQEEATFGKTAWFDIQDDVADEDKEDVIALRDQLLEDFELAGVPAAISEAYLLGALYGNGIGKINVALEPDKTIVRSPATGELMVQETERVVVRLEAIRPDEFFIDPAARCLDEAMFCGHDITKPRSAVEAKLDGKKYRAVVIPEYKGSIPNAVGSPDGLTEVRADVDEMVLITEYYGKVPYELLEGAKKSDSDSAGYVEAIVTIANDSVLLKAVLNPFTMKDRPIIAYAHDTVPGQFWGRSVSEKGYNSQKALDGTLRTQMDAMALAAVPMMGADITRMPRNPDVRVRPGRVFYTRGVPSEVLQPIGFAPPPPETFQQSADFERMVQVATGATAAVTPLNVNRRNETAAGISMQGSSFIKRSKRTMFNIERNFLDKLIEKALWRYMQFDPMRYPVDYKFVVNSTMGIMAKEVEQAQLTNLIGFIPPDSPAFPVMIKAIFDNSSSANKKDLMAAIQAMIQPPSEEDQQMTKLLKEAEMRRALAEAAEAEARAMKLQADAALAEAKRLHTLVQAELEDDYVTIQAANASTGAERIRIARENLNVGREKNMVALAKTIADARIKSKQAAAKSTSKSTTQ